MKIFNVKRELKHLTADLFTPVGIYLNLREEFPNTFLLESTDYHGTKNSMSFICVEPVAEFMVVDNQIAHYFPDTEAKTSTFKQKGDVSASYKDFLAHFKFDSDGFDGPGDGLFGYCSFNAVNYFETLQIGKKTRRELEIPDIDYRMFQIVIAFNHFNNQIVIQENRVDKRPSLLEKVSNLIRKPVKAELKFSLDGNEHSPISDEDFRQMVERGRHHCKIGDVFQVVMSRSFEQGFKGNAFQVYRTLRSINPSPYLFYFDYGDFRLFGSSPEAQIRVENGYAIINPIAGTFKRTGNDAADRELAMKLADDEKENAEHVMLVDLARNDLSRNCTEVRVDMFKDIQFYSHVIHMVSEVKGKLKPNVTGFKILEDTFPAGTLSGAPKYRALELIEENETQERGFYGGAIGFLGFNHSVNHAIMIRTMMSKNHVLYYQAGAGVVERSVPESELQEVNHKLGALKKAIELAGDLPV